MKNEIVEFFSQGGAIHDEEKQELEKLNEYELVGVYQTYFCKEP